MERKARKAISTRRRFEIFKRDGFICQYCGAHPPMVILHVDHIVPVAEGGDNDESNLTTACEKCNLGKAAVPLSSVPKSLAEQAVETAEREAQLKGYSDVMRQSRQRLEDDAWDVANVFIEQFSDTGIRKDWFHSIKGFVEKMGAHEVIVSMQCAVVAKPYSQNVCFRYFCGICWNKIKGGA